MKPTHLLYLHGFRSSPQSTKARAVAAWVAAQRPDLVWACPQLPPSPREAMLMRLIHSWRMSRFFSLRPRKPICSARITASLATVYILRRPE